MKEDLAFVYVLLRSRPFLIMGLSVCSGYTTFLGLSLYVRWWPVALIFTIAVQSLIVIGTLQLSMNHWRASAIRILSILACVALAMGVSVYFSYFSFYQMFEAEKITRAKFHQLNSSINVFVDEVLAAKGKVAAAQTQIVSDLRRAALQEAVGANGRPGKGPRYAALSDEVKVAERRLNELQQTDSAEQKAVELRAFMEKTSPAAMSEGAYDQLQTLIAGTTSAVGHFTQIMGLPPIKSPTIMTLAEYKDPMPSLANLSRVSPVAASLALLFDLFTVFLTFWLESVPLGGLKDEEKDMAVEGVIAFTDWQVNHNNQLDFRLSKTEIERNAGVNDGERMFWATALLNRGFLKRVDASRAEFGPRLYAVVSDYFRRKRNVSPGS